MKQCPKCNSTYADDSLNFCLIDGTTLVPVFDSEATRIPKTKPELQPTIVSLGFSPTPQAPPPNQPSRSGFSIWLIVLPILGIGLIVLVVAAVLLIPKLKDISRSGSDPSETPAASPDITPRPSSASSPTPKPTPTTVPERSPSPPPSPQPTSQSSVPGVYPQASTRLLNDADLAYKSCFDLKVMRNEPYARHGYIFHTPDMANYFSRQSWYHADYEDVFNMLTPTEKRNAEYIKSNEAARGCK